MRPGDRRREVEHANPVERVHRRFPLVASPQMGCERGLIVKPPQRRRARVPANARHPCHSPAFRPASDLPLVAAFNRRSASCSPPVIGGVNRWCAPPVTCCYRRPLLRGAAGGRSSPHESKKCNTIVAILSSSRARPLLWQTAKARRSKNRPQWCRAHRGRPHIRGHLRGDSGRSRGHYRAAQSQPKTLLSEPLRRSFSSSCWLRRPTITRSLAVKRLNTLYCRL